MGNKFRNKTKLTCDANKEIMLQINFRKIWHFANFLKKILCCQHDKCHYFLVIFRPNALKTWKHFISTQIVWTFSYNQFRWLMQISPSHWNKTEHIPKPANNGWKTRSLWSRKKHKQLLNAKMSIKNFIQRWNLSCKKRWKSLFCVLSTWWWWRWKPQKAKIPISNNDWCFCSMVAFVVELFSCFFHIQPNKRKLFFCVWRWAKQSREKSRKCSIFTIALDDGMYHLKVINLKISRERRQDLAEIKKEKFAYRSFEFK